MARRGSDCHPTMAARKSGKGKSKESDAGATAATTMFFYIGEPEARSEEEASPQQRRLEDPGQAAAAPATATRNRWSRRIPVPASPSPYSSGDTPSSDDSTEERTAVKLILGQGQEPRQPAAAKERCCPAAAKIYEATLPRARGDATKGRGERDLEQDTWDEGTARCSSRSSQRPGTQLSQHPPPPQTPLHACVGESSLGAAGGQCKRAERQNCPEAAMGKTAKQNQACHCEQAGGAAARSVFANLSAPQGPDQARGARRVPAFPLASAPLAAETVETPDAVALYMARRKGKGRGDDGRHAPPRNQAEKSVTNPLPHGADQAPGVQPGRREGPAKAQRTEPADSGLPAGSGEGRPDGTCVEARARAAPRSDPRATAVPPSQAKRAGAAASSRGRTTGRCEQPECWRQPASRSPASKRGQRRRRKSQAQGGEFQQPVEQRVRVDTCCTSEVGDRTPANSAATHPSSSHTGGFRSPSGDGAPTPVLPPTVASAGRLGELALSSPTPTLTTLPQVPPFPWCLAAVETRPRAETDWDGLSLHEKEALAQGLEPLPCAFQRTSCQKREKAACILQAAFRARRDRSAQDLLAEAAASLTDVELAKLLAKLASLCATKGGDDARTLTKPLLRELLLRRAPDGCSSSFADTG